MSTGTNGAPNGAAANDFATPGPQPPREGGKRYLLNAKEAEFFARGKRTIDETQTTLRGALMLIMSQQSLDGNVQLSADGSAIEEI